MTLAAMRRRAGIGGALGVGQLLGRGALALATLAFAHALPVDAFGRLMAALAVGTIAVALGDGGVSRLLVRDVARAEPERREPLALRLLAVRLVPVAAVQAALAAALLAGWLPLSAGAALLFLAWCLGEALAAGFEQAAVGAERPWRFAAAQAGGAVALAVGVALLLAADDATIEDALVVLAASSAAKLALHALVWRRAAGCGGGPVAPTLRAALPFLALAAITTLYYRLAVPVVYALDGGGEAASLGAALRVMDAVGAVGVVAFGTLAPAFARAHRDRPDELWGLWLRTIAGGLAFALPLAVLLATFAEPLCGLLFGERYEQSAGADLRALAPAIGLLVLLQLSAALAFTGDRQRPVVLLAALNLAVCAGAVTAFGALWGSTGAAAGVSLAEAVSFAGLALLIARRRP